MKVLLENWKKYINEAPETKKKASKLAKAEEEDELEEVEED